MSTFHLYAAYNDVDISSVMGKPDYSYWFVQSYFETALSQLGDTRILTSLSIDPSSIDCAETFLLAFMPPDQVPRDLAAVAIPVFAWEYDTLPNEPWGGDDRHDWISVLSRSPGAITHSGLVREEVRRALGDDYPVVSVVSPLFEKFSPLGDVPKPRSWSISGRGVLIDSRDRASTAMFPLPEDFWADDENGTKAEMFAPEDFNVELDGVVYTAVFNPSDGRKQWVELLSAFVAALGHEPDATLVLKLVHVDVERGAPVVYGVADHLGEFKCRVVVIQGHLDDESYSRLVGWSSFAVNSSRGEGQCLPLLESMSAGVPVVAPDHTAMADYVDAGNAFVVGHTRGWTNWSHDPRLLLSCFTFPVVWESLRDRLAESHAVISRDEERYRAMCTNARESARSMCSADVVRRSLDEFFGQVRARRASRNDR